MISIKYQEKWTLISLSIDLKFQDEKCIMTCLLKIKCSYFTWWTAVWTTKTRQTKFVLQGICAVKIGEGADGNHIHTHLLTLFVYSQNVTCWYLSKDLSVDSGAPGLSLSESEPNVSCLIQPLIQVKLSVVTQRSKCQIYQMPLVVNVGNYFLLIGKLICWCHCKVIVNKMDIWYDFKQTPG